jgi:hypothetical protein
MECRPKYIGANVNHMEELVIPEVICECIVLSTHLNMMCE